MVHIISVGDNVIVVKGSLPLDVVQELYMPIKKGLPVPKSVVMTPPMYDAEADTSTFSFYFATNTVKGGDLKLGAVLVNEAVTRFVEALMAKYDGDTPEAMAAEAMSHVQVMNAVGGGGIKP